MAIVLHNTFLHKPHAWFQALNELTKKQVNSQKLNENKYTNYCNTD